MKYVTSVGDVGPEAGWRPVSALDAEIIAAPHGRGFRTCGRNPGYYARNAGGAVAAKVLCHPFT
jgi:hypothetical protein